MELQPCKKNQLVAFVLLFQIILLCSNGCEGLARLIGWTIGPRTVTVYVSDGELPAFSWKGGAVESISVTLPDSVIFVHSSAADTTRVIARAPIVWGYKTSGEDGKHYAGIHSPVFFGEIIEDADDLSDYRYCLPKLSPGVRYKVTVSAVCTLYGRKYFVP